MLSRLVKNNVETTKFCISFWLRFRLMISSLEECQALLKGAVTDGTWIYIGSHHLAVVHGGRSVLRVKDKAYS